MRNFNNFRSQLESEYAQVVKFSHKTVESTPAAAKLGAASKFDAMVKSGSLQRRPSLIK
jgi:hypothetical protein